MNQKNKIILISALALFLIGAAAVWFLRSFPLLPELITVVPDDVALVLDHNDNRVSDFLDQKLHQYKPDEKVPVIITAKPGVDQSSLVQFGAEPLIDNVFITQVTKDQLQQLSGLEAILIVEEDQIVRGYQVGDLGDFDLGAGGDAVSQNPNRAPPRVAVLDSGVDPVHPLIGENKIVGWYDAVDYQTAPYDDEVIYGRHGTKVTATLLYNAPDDTEVVAVKVLDRENRGSVSDAVEGLQWISINADELNIRVVNMSFGFRDYNYAMHRVINQLSDQDIIMVAAAGNENTERVSYPAAYDEVIAVGAYDSETDKVAKFSNRGREIDVAADGVNVILEKNGELFNIGSGTSFSAPIVGGKILELITNEGITDPDIIKKIILGMAEDVGKTGFDRESGAGLISGDTTYDTFLEDMLVEEGAVEGEVTEPKSEGEVPSELVREIAGAAMREQYVMTVVGGGKDRTKQGQFAIGFEEWYQQRHSSGEKSSRHVLHYTGGAIPRYGHTMTMLKDGRVLIAGGINGIIPLQSAVLYNPEIRNFEPVNGPMTQARAWHSATLLPKGDVLILGGYGDLNTKAYDMFNISRRPLLGGSGLGTAEGSFYAAYRPALYSRSPLRTGEIYVAKKREFMSLQEYFRLEEEPKMNVGRARHTATFIPSQNKILVLGGITGTYESELQQEVAVTDELEEDGVLASLSSNKDILAKMDTAEITFILHDKNPPSSGKWTRKTKVKLTIDGPARFRDIDPKTGETREDAGLTGNVQTVEFYLYPGSTPWKYKTKIISYGKNRDLGDITITAEATYLKKYYKRSIQIDRDHTLKRTEEEDHTLKARGESLVIDFSSDKDLVGRAETANLSVVFDDNRDNDLPRFKKARGTITIDGPARLWVTDEDLGKNVGHPEEGSANKFEFTLNPKYMPNQLPYYPDVPQLRLLSYFGNRDLGDITVTVKIFYDNTWYERKLFIKRDHTRAPEPPDEETSKPLKKAISYSIKVDQDTIAHDQPAKITVRMDDTRELKRANRTKEAVIHFQAQGAVSLKYYKPVGLLFVKYKEVIAKELKIVIYPRLTPRVAVVEVIQTGGDPKLAGAVSVQITYERSYYPVNPKIFGFHPTVTDVDKVKSSGPPDFVEYSLSAEASVLSPGERTTIELIFRDKRTDEDYEGAGKGNRGQDAPAHIIVEGGGYLVWRGKELVDLKTTLQPGWYYWKIKADLVSRRSLPEDNESVRLISKVEYYGRTYQKAIEISRNPSDEGEYQSMVDNVNLSEPAADLSGAVTGLSLDFQTEDNPSQQVMISAEPEGEELGFATRVLRDFVRAKPSSGDGFGGEVFGLRLNKRTFEPIETGLSGSAQHIAIGLDGRYVLIAGHDYGVAIYDGKTDYFYRAGKLSVSGNITYAIQRNENNMPVAVYLFGSRQVGSAQMINLGDFSSAMVTPNISPESVQTMKEISSNKYGSATKHFGGFAQAVNLTGNSYLLTASNAGTGFHFLYDLDSNIAHVITDTLLPVYKGPTAFVEGGESGLKTYGSKSNPLAVDLWSNKQFSSLPAQHSAVSLNDGTALIYGGKLPVDYSIVPGYIAGLASKLVGGSPYLDPISEQKDILALKDNLFDQLYFVLNAYSFSEEDFLLIREVFSHEVDAITGYARWAIERDNEWHKLHRVSDSASYAAFVIEPRNIPPPEVAEATDEGQAAIEDDEVVGSSDVGGILDRPNPPEHEYEGEVLQGGEPDNRAEKYQFNSRTYELQITFDESYLSPALGSSIKGRVQLLEDGNPVRSVPEGLWSPFYQGGGFYHTGGAVPYVHLTAMNLDSEGRSTGNPISYYQPDLDNYIYSPQAGVNIEHNRRQITVPGLDLSQGSAEFEFFYGGGRTRPYVQFKAETALGVGKYIKTLGGVYFEDQKESRVAIPNLDTVNKGDFYYDVKLSAGLAGDGTYDGTFPLRALSEGKESVVKIEITSRDARTGRINTNIYQRVDIFVYPANRLFNLNYKKVRTTESGSFGIDDEGTITQSHVYQSSVMTIGYKYVIIDLIEGRGVAYFRYNGSKWLAPYLTVAVWPVTYVLESGASPLPPDEAARRARESREKYGVPYRTSHNIEYPLRPVDVVDENGQTISYRYLYGEWLTDDQYKDLQHNVYTIKTIPIK